MIINQIKLINNNKQIDAVNYGLIDSAYRESSKKCRLTLAKETVGSPPFVVSLFAKNSPYTKAINKQYEKMTKKIKGTAAHKLK